MKSIGIIPLRAGSKSIKNKNKIRIIGRPLFAWVLGESIFSNLDEVYIFTNDSSIIEYVEKEFSWTSKVKCIKRNEQNASDTASTEDAMMEFSENIDHNYDLICLLQATSPTTTRYDINAALDKVMTDGYDSCLSVVESKRFVWSEKGKSLNYDYKKRPRRQDFSGMLIENGAVYVTSKEQFFNSKNRLGGKISVLKMPEESYYEIDERSDLIIVESLLTQKLKENKINGNSIDLLILDVDGVFTDGKVSYYADGEFSKTFSLRDGMGLELLRETGVDILVMTSEVSDIVKSRMEKLGLELISGVKDKFARLEFELNKRGISREKVAYIGDDINDLSNMCSVGWSLCPANAVDAVKSHADIILTYDSGDMALREATRFIINYNKRK